MPLSLDFSQIKPLIEIDTLVLTPNSRTQKAIINGQLVGLPCNTVIQTIDVRSFSQWIDQLWTELSFHQVLPKRISDLVVRSWLEQQISKETAWTLTNLSGVASKAQEAYKNLAQWDLSLNDLKHGGSIDSVEIEYFIQWIDAFEQFCQRKHLIANFLSLRQLNNAVGQIANTIPKHILMVGFEHLTPLEELFLQSLDKHGIKIDKYNYVARENNSKQIGFCCLREELEFAAQYAKKYVERKNHSGKAKDSNNTLAVVVEQLANHLGEVHAAFSREFHPEESKPWVPVKKPDYNVSAGFSLAEQPLVVAALSILNLKNYQISREEIQFLKNTPFVRWHGQNIEISVAENRDIDDTSKEYNSQIRQFLHTLCFSPRKSFSIKYLLKKIGGHESREQLQPLANALQKLSDVKTSSGAIQEHINHWKARLAFFSWVGVTAENSRGSLNEFEDKACAEFFDAMEKTKEIENISNKPSPHDALNFLNQQVVSKSFQIASDHSQVQILGILEASGLQFDELLVVGFNADNWPQKNKINPFLPLDFQRQHNMPGSSAQREFDYAKALSTGLLNSSQKIIATSNNESINREYNEAVFFSSLVWVSQKDLPELLIKPVESKNDRAIKPNYEWVEDSQVNLVNSVHSGGAYLLSEYAKCPFRAISHFQLKLNGYPEIELGLDARAKGSWLHGTMELIWATLKSKKQLMALDLEGLNKLIKDSLDSALEQYQEHFLATTQVGLVNIEKNKLFQRILEWLMIEKQRDDFEIQALEKNVELKLGSLPLQFRIDRIDKKFAGDSSSTNNANINVNTHVKIKLIDYKSGKVDVKDWFGVRPTEAQMPAYILALDQQSTFEHGKSVADIASATDVSAQQIIDGLSYAQIKTGSVSQQGLIFSRDESGERVLKLEHNIEERKESLTKGECGKDYQSVVNDWSATLHRISQGITGGWTPVSPKDSGACNYCDYRAICRIDESQPSTQEIHKQENHKLKVLGSNDE